MTSTENIKFSYHVGENYTVTTNLTWEVLKNFPFKKY